MASPLPAAPALPAGQPLDWRWVAGAVAQQTLGRRFVYLARTGSTNDVARDLARAGEPEGAAVFADEQVSGRGRAGKSPWLLPPRTSIALSLVLRPRLPPGDLPRISIAAGVAAAGAIQDCTGLAAALKWPNDVVAGGRKLGGILAESALAGSHVSYVALGIGLNVNFPAAALGPLPGAALPPTTIQDEVGRPVSRERLLVALLRRLDHAYSALQAGGFAPIHARYRQLLRLLGRPVQIAGGLAPVEGIAEDVTPEGSLVVRLASGERRLFSYGEVSVRPHPLPP